MAALIPLVAMEQWVAMHGPAQPSPDSNALICSFAISGYYEGVLGHWVPPMGLDTCGKSSKGQALGRLPPRLGVGGRVGGGKKESHRAAGWCAVFQAGCEEG